jgi:hypothetical protein
MKKLALISFLTIITYIVDGTQNSIHSTTLTTLTDTINPLTGANQWIYYSEPNKKHNVTITGTIASDTLHH